MEYLSNLVLMLILFFTLVSANKDQKAQELRNQIKPGGASTITEGCNDDMRKFGPYNIYTCNCRYLESCDFSNMGKCKTKKCLSGYGGPFCQLRFFHEYLKQNINETKNVFTNVSKKINNFLNITFKKDRRIHSLKFSCQSSVSETNITLKIGSTKFYEGKCKNVTQTGDASGKYLLIETTHNVSFSMLRVFGCSPLWFGPKCDKQCHCANYTECHKISGNCPMGCESGRSGPDCQKLNYENVALKKNASQSSTYNSSTILLNDTCQKHDFNFSADLAVDGNTDQQFERRSCIQTVSKRLHPYWQVDLGESYNISQIRIYHRNANLYRIRDVAISVDNIYCNTIEREEKKFIFDIKCMNILEGRIINITRKSTKDWPLNFCEVEVLQCLPGFYGYRCKNSCPECKNSSCEQWTGTCQLGCALGYKLSNTCTACQFGTFGEGCSQTCHCKNNIHCNKKNGSCIPDECEIGYKGFNCQEPCSTGTFGERCLQTCHCKNNDNCNKINGSCGPEGCEAGYKGPTCQESCPIGTFGDGCSQTCHCKKNTNCNKKDGSCILDVCEAGYKGFSCQESCSTGTFGEGCWQTCHCKNNDNCNKKNGSCGPEGCEAGYKGPICQESKFNIYIPIFVGSSIIVIIIVGLIIYFKVKRSKKKEKDTSKRVQIVSLQGSIEMDPVADNIDDDYTYIEPVDNKEYINMNTMYAR